MATVFGDALSGKDEEEKSVNDVTEAVKKIETLTR